MEVAARAANRRYIYTSRPACGDMADSEGEFLGESLDDKEDLDRFKIPISGGFSRGEPTYHPPLPPAAISPAETTVTKSGNTVGISRRRE